jgi:hypothetical protein
MERGMDGMEPAAATNSAVFGRNRFGMCCEENILAFEVQAMNEWESKRASEQDASVSG